MMKLANRKLEKAASTDQIRHFITEPYLDVDNSLIVATNGHIMAVCPVELDEGDTSGYVSSECIKAGIKASPVTKRTDKTANIKANGSLVLDNNQTFPRPELGTFPDYKRVLPDPSKAEMVISLDAKLLKDLADAINTPGSSVIKLHIKDNKTAFYVESDKNSECYGVIMPCAV